MLQLLAKKNNGHHPSTMADSGASDAKNCSGKSWQTVTGYSAGSQRHFMDMPHGGSVARYAWKISIVSDVSPVFSKMG